MLIALIVLASLLVLYFGLLVLTRARNPAGIPTSRVGRALRLGGLSIRLGLRALPSRVRRWVTPKSKREALVRKQQEDFARSAAAAMGSMKGVLMKLGQIMSFMEEALPEPVVQALRPLQAQAPPMSLEAVAAAVERELGDAPDLLFTTFDSTPLAAASIGQVHRATLPGGMEVAVKVQYPGVARAIRADLDNATALASMIGALTPTLDAQALAIELHDRLLEELDYRIEADNQQLFRRIHAEEEAIHIPEVIVELSSERVLVSELVSGMDFYTFCDTASEEAKQRAAMAIHHFVFESLWIHNVFNADPHPGNFLFDSNGKVTCLDFGSVKRFDPSFIANMKKLTRSYLDGDSQAFYDLSCELGFILPGQERKVSKEWLWDFVEWFHEPIAKDAPFRFTPEYTRRAIGQVFGDNMRKVNMPPDYLMMNRITFGVNSLLTRLGACHNWHRLALHYLDT